MALHPLTVIWFASSVGTLVELIYLFHGKVAAGIMASWADQDHRVAVHVCFSPYLHAVSDVLGPVVCPEIFLLIKLVTHGIKGLFEASLADHVGGAPGKAENG